MRGAMKEVRYAVVGAGWIAQEAFMPAVAQTGNSRMTAIVSGSPTNAAKLAEFYGISHVYDYSDFDAMLSADVVDAVYIALPNAMHANFAIRAAQAGKHVLVEKPLAVTVKECEAMIAAAEAAGVWLMTAYRLHNEPGTVEVLEQIRNGAIGEPQIFISAFSFQSDPHNHRLKAEHWGGPLQDIGVYCLNAARHVFGSEPIEVSAMKSHGDGDQRFKEVEGTMAVTLRFPGDRLAQFIVSFGAASMDMDRVIGTKGSISVEPGYRFETATRMTLSLDGNGGDDGDGGAAAPEFASIDHFGAQTAYFSDCILNRSRPEADGGEGLADVRALLAIEQAAVTGLAQKIATPPRPTHPTPDMVRMIPRTDRRLLL